MAAAGCPLAVSGSSRMSPAFSAGQLRWMSAPMAGPPRYQPVNGGISQTASSVNIVTRVSMS